MASAFSQPGQLVRLSETSDRNRICQPGRITPGLTANKMNVLHFAVQMTHCTGADKLTIPGFALAGSSLSRKHGLATFVHDPLKWTFVDQSPTTSETEWLCVDVNGYRIVNVYKPQPTRLQASALPVFPHLVLYAGNFNCPHVNWGYRTSSAGKECLVAWASLNGFVPLHDPKDVATFHSGRWNTGTNPDLTLVSVDPDSRAPDRRIL